LTGDNLAKWITETRSGLLTGELESVIAASVKELVPALRLADRA
jgi:hypothetical protein